MMRFVTILFLVMLLLVILIDAFFHFDQERIQIKRQHQSAQRHWSFFYSQKFTYTDSSFKYEQDVRNIRTLLEPNKLLLSDKATSYYLAAELPVYITNVHAHHDTNIYWTRFLRTQQACYLEQVDSLEKALTFFQQQASPVDGEQQLFKYWVVNKDKGNLNLRYDCLSARSSSISEGLTQIAELIYQGEYLWLYQLN